MSVTSLKDKIKGVDIYVLDQILKDRYKLGDKILDAGCGKGRNLKWFYQLGFEIFGIDVNKENIDYCKTLYSNQKENFIVSTVEQIPFENNYFDHIICNAVLHFAKDYNEYIKMFEELIRVLKPEGTLFVRIASEFGIEDKVKFLNNGCYKLPDESTRFLLTQNMLTDLKNISNITLLEDVKTTLVENKRSMTTLIIMKI